MAYEVTKFVNGRPYRYRVQSERDGETGKSRNRWTYLGRAGAGPVAGVAKPRPNAREALLDALERLLDRSDPSDVTASAVSIEAGLAHGTFYRYFRNLVDAIRALATRLRTIHAAQLGALDSPPADLAAARAALRAWTGVLLSTRTEHHGFVRALYSLAAKDDAIHAAVLERRETNAQRLSAWLRDLAERGIIPRPAPPDAGAVLFTMLESIGRDTVAVGQPLPEREVETALGLVERAVFGVLP